MSVCKTPKAPVRLLLGIQMFLYGFFSTFTSYETVLVSKWLPASMLGMTNLTILSTGVVVLVPCFAEIWGFKNLCDYERNRIPSWMLALARLRTMGYAFSGCMWLALWYFGLLDGRVSSVDFVGPVYVATIVALYFADASMQRRVHCGYEKRRPFVVLYH